MTAFVNRSDFRQGRWGMACKDGKLYHFTDRHVLVMRGWPAPLSWFKRRSHGWQPTRKWADEVVSSQGFFDASVAKKKPLTPFTLPDGQMVLPGILDQEERAAWASFLYDAARLEFVKAVPPEVRAELDRYSNRKWHIMSLLARCPGALDLSQSNPALLYALASNWVFHKPAVARPIAAARRLVWKKQRAILEWLGFPGTEPVRRILAKIEPAAVDAESLLYLRAAVVNPDCVKLLSHLHRLNRDVVLMAADRRLIEHVTPRLLGEVLAPPEQKLDPDVAARRPESMYRLLLDTVRMARVVDWEGCPRAFSSLKRLGELHDELVPRMTLERMRKEDNLPVRFPDPPFPGNDRIIPLMTPGELCEEGQAQHNCVGSHAVDVADGKEFVYRVEEPVRGTLAVVRVRGVWREFSFLAACNQRIAPKVTRSVFDELFRSAKEGPVRRRDGGAERSRT